MAGGEGGRHGVEERQAEGGAHSLQNRRVSKALSGVTIICVLPPLCSPRFASNRCRRCWNGSTVDDSKTSAWSL